MTDPNKAIDQSTQEPSINNIKNLFKRLIGNIGLLSLVEFKTVGTSLSVMLGFSVVVALLLFTIWGLAMLITGIFLAHYSFSLLEIFTLLLLIQIAVCGLILIFMVRYRKKLLFPMTCEALTLFKR